MHERMEVVRHNRQAQLWHLAEEARAEADRRRLHEEQEWQRRAAEVLVAQRRDEQEQLRREAEEERLRRAAAEEARQLTVALANSVREIGSLQLANGMNEGEAPPVIQPDTPWREIPALYASAGMEVQGCRAELAANEGICAAVPRIASLVRCVTDKFEDVRHHDARARAYAASLTDDELFAIIAYTNDFQLPNNERSGNLYFELNNALRSNSEHARQWMMATWGLFVHYILSGLDKLPCHAGVVLRGIPRQCDIAQQYSNNRLIQWRGFSSSSNSLGEAARFGPPGDVLIFRITVTRGKVIRLLSLFPQEDEILLYPGMRFRVTRAAYVGADGYTYVDMTEETPMLVF